MDEAVVQTGPACSETYSIQIDRNNAAWIENSQRVRTGVGDEPSVQCCPLTWSRRRSQPHCEPIRHNPECSLRRIHQNAGSFVRPLFLISVGPSTNFRTMRDRNTFLNHNGKPFTHLPVCTALWGSHLHRDRSHPRLHWGFFLACFFLGICESAFFPVSSHRRIPYTYSYGMAGSVVSPFEMVQAQ